MPIKRHNKCENTNHYLLDTLKPFCFLHAFQCSPNEERFFRSNCRLILIRVAAILDIPLGTAKSRLSYGVATVRDLIKEKEKRPSAELGMECTVIIFLCLAMGVCTAKILSLINKNAKAILQAIADRHQR